MLPSGAVFNGSRDSMGLKSLLSGEEPPSTEINGTTTSPTNAIGVLTRTMVRSPVIKWILRARIRHKDKNDVVFIGERSVEIKDFSQGRHLRSVAIKTDFDSTIRAACIMGDAPNSSSEYADGDRVELKDESDMEEDVMEVDSTGPELPPQILVLSLQSEIRDSLVFMFAYHDHRQNLNFLSYTRPLPAASTLPEHASRVARLGARMTIDPRSRAMAVAAEYGQLMLINLKSKELLGSENQHPSGLYSESFRPIRQERLLDIKGNIQNMEFLYPPREKDRMGIYRDARAYKDTVILAVLFRPIGKAATTRSYLMWTEWDCTRDLHDVTFDWRKYPLPNNEVLPSLLIPLMLSSGLLLACQDRMYHYKDLLSGYTSPTEIPYQEQEDLDDIESSRAPAIYTSWARPIRRYENDNLYLCRSDGTISFCEMGKRDPSSNEEDESSEHSVDRVTEHLVGKVPVAMENAFACLDTGTGTSLVADHGSFDMLAIAGNTSDGGLFECTSRAENIPRLQRISNWAPTVDFAVISGADNGLDADPMVKVAPCNIINKDRLFTCANQGPRYGNLCEMRYGLEAQSSFDFPLDALGDIDKNSVRRVWLLPEHDPDSNSHYLPELAHLPDKAVLVVSYHDTSDRATISWQGHPLENSATSYTEKLIDRSRATIAMSTTQDGLAIQVNENSLRAIVIPAAGRTAIDLLEHSFTQGTITHAHIDGNSSSCLAVLRTESRYCTALVRISVNQQQTKLQAHCDLADLDSEAACAFLTSVGKDRLGLVGLADGRIVAYDCKGTRPVPLCEHTFRGDTAICESICVIRKSRSRDSTCDPVVLCGLRNGTVHILQLVVSSTGAASFKFSERLDVGLIGVSILPDAASQPNQDGLPVKAVVLSGDCFCRVFYTSEDAEDITIQCIWITHPEFQGLQPTDLQNLAQYEPWDRHGSAFAKAVLCIDREHVRLVRLANDTQSVAVPRRIQLNGSPTRVIYSQQLGKLVVAFTYAFIPEDGSESINGKRPRRLLYPMIKVIDPDCACVAVKDEASDDDEDSTAAPPGCTVVGNSGGKILGIVEWRPTLSSKPGSWALLAVNTIQAQNGGAQEHGCVYIYRLDIQAKGTVKVTLKKKVKHDDPVYAMATLGSDMLVLGTGTDLIVQQLTTQEGGLKLPTIARKSMRAPANHISVNGNDIYVSMAHGSVAMFSLNEQLLVEKLNDQIDRVGHHHVLIPDRNLIMASDRSPAVRGLLCPQQETMDASFKPVFEVILPCTISRLRVASLNPRRGSIGRRDRQEIIGSGFNGQFCSFELLSYDEWRLLRFIYNLARKSRQICPFTYEDYLTRPVEPKVSERNMHIDGDILARMLQNGNRQAMTYLYGFVQGAGDQYSGYVSAEDAEQRLFSLIQVVLPFKHEENPYRVAVVFMRGILQIDS